MLNSFLWITARFFLIDSSHQVQGTIFPAPNFNPIMDAQMLGGALQGFGKPNNFYLLL